MTYLGESLDKVKVLQKEKYELLAVASSLKANIVKNRSERRKPAYRPPSLAFIRRA
ncbi:MAG TPA: hypothetical protein VK416_04850 [Thermoanaerobaculia bacterium]|nr:hypothetical protein [Thermoanaerobaculia bacterium]